MNIKNFIITHKEIDMPKPSGFEPLLVGAENHPEITCYNNKDNQGENISFKNANYCELTGIYWIWKNIRADVTGICHYRRYFTKAVYSMSSDYFLNSDDIIKLMGKYDVIVPKIFYYKKSIIESVNIAPNKADMLELEKAIKFVSPNYYETYTFFINGKKSYLYNMCIMKKQYFDAYCEWLFKILQFIEDDYDISNEDAYRSRLFGFLSERLLSVWLEKNISKEKIKQCRVVKIDESAFRSKLHDLKNCYKHIAGAI